MCFCFCSFFVLPLLPTTDRHPPPPSEDSLHTNNGDSKTRLASPHAALLCHLRCSSRCLRALRLLQQGHERVHVHRVRGGGRVRLRPPHRVVPPRLSRKRFAAGPALLRTAAPRRVRAVLLRRTHRLRPQPAGLLLQHRRRRRTLRRVPLQRDDDGRRQQPQQYLRANNHPRCLRGRPPGSLDAARV